MKLYKFILFIGFILPFNSLYAQKAERDFIRKGNKQYSDSAFVEAEISYRKALEANPKSTTGMYNLGNALLFQNKAQDAMNQYSASSKMENDKSKLGNIWHNIGVIFQGGKEYEKAIEAYKQALRNAPHDDETRYNLALCQKLLKDKNQNPNNQNQKEEKEKKQEQQNTENKKQQAEQNSDKNQISKDNAEQILRSLLQDERNTQFKVKKQQQQQGTHLKNDW